jgi:glycosyltransferase involved in cell wall biosynthesis
MGTGPAQKDLQDLTKVLGLEEHVWFVGWVGDRQKLLSSLSAADICVQPDPSSPLNDASTMVKTMEYMALGKPVVAFDLPETRHTGGDTILYAQPNDEKDFADQLARLMDDAELRHRLGEQGCQRIAARFTWDHAVVNLLQAYETLRVGR